MKKRFLSLVIFAMLVVCVFPTVTFAEEKSEDIVILYENDVHCSVEGYSKLSALKKELQETYKYVGVVSSGDYIQGSSLGIVSKGEYIIELINLVGYDALALGNHEFDYYLDRLDELIGMMNVKPVCCNFVEVGSGEAYYDPYTIVTYGDVKVAYLGVITPATLTSVPISQFMDENGNYLYTFSSENLYSVIQKNVDAARNEGADYVIALTHLGDQELTFNVLDMIPNTNGIDVVLDAHSHSVIENKIVKNSLGEDVLLTSTGTKFENIGKLTISDGKISTELIKTSEYEKTDPVVDAHIAEIMSEFQVLGDRIVASSEVELYAYDDDGNRLVRKYETNLGNFCSDAFRVGMGADIAYMNGGALRANLEAGDVTFNDLLTLYPFNNQPILAEISGQDVLDLLEMAMYAWPEEAGSFPHVSGMTFSYNSSIPSSVIVDQDGFFVEVDGDYRVYNVKIFNDETGKYEPLDLTKRYTLCATNFVILELGGGMSMLADAEILRNEGILDVEIMEMYIIEHLNGVIGEEYGETNRHITFTDGFVEDTDNPSTSDSSYVKYTILLSVSAILTLSVIFFKKRAIK